MSALRSLATGSFWRKAAGHAHVRFWRTRHIGGLRLPFDGRCRREPS
jgi:hypothetical protein